jgi:catechol 2,3-dioxygenase-like lactoylglutathione lyase family enzyme
MTVLPGPVRQVGYVVDDLDRAIAGWLELGVGPWFVMRGLALQADYRGEPCETTLSLAFANSGEMQIELIQQMDATPSIFTEILAAHGPGLHQLAFWARDFAATMNEVEKAGWPVVWSGGEGYGVRFAYVEPPNAPAAVIEISELTDATAANAVFIHDAAAEWDGTNPVRDLTG